MTPLVYRVESVIPQYEGYRTCRLTRPAEDPRDLPYTLEFRTRDPGLTPGLAVGKVVTLSVGGDKPEGA